MRFIVLDGGVQRLDVRLGDIGGIGHDALELSQGFLRLFPGVRLHGHHPGGKAVAADVLAADLQGPVRPLPQHHPGLGHLGRHRQPDAAAAGAQVQHPAFPQGLDIANGLLRQHLRVRPGNQHVPGDVQREPIELPLTDKVCHRLALQMPPHQVPDPVLQLRGGVQSPIPGQLLPALVSAEANQLPGLQRGLLDPCPPQLLADIQIQIVVCRRHNTPHYQKFTIRLSLFHWARPAPGTGWRTRSWSRPAHWW